MLPAHDCEPVDASFFGRAPQTMIRTVETRVPPATVFATFSETESWLAWAKGLRRIEWRGSPGLGCERRVTLDAGMFGDERFFEWRVDRGVSFCFTRTNLPGVRRFAERYRLEENPRGGTWIEWTMAIDAGLPLGPALPMVRPVAVWELGRWLRRFGRLLDEGRLPVGR